MALSDTINDITNAARKCRIERLLDTIDAEDAVTLRQALNNRRVKPSVLTAALRKEYGTEAVTHHSVSDWRRKNQTEITGL